MRDSAFISLQLPTQVINIPIYGSLTKSRWQYGEVLEGYEVEALLMLDTLREMTHWLMVWSYMLKEVPQ
jgi:hypothetical protein